MNDSDNEQRNDKVAFADSDSNFEESDQEVDSSLKWKSNILDRAAANFSKKRRSIMDIVYSNDDLAQPNEPKKSASAEDQEDDFFFHVVEKQTYEDAVDSSRMKLSSEELKEWDDEDMLQSIRDHFITGEMPVEKSGEEEELHGDFEDLEATGGGGTSEAVDSAFGEEGSVEEFGSESEDEEDKDDAAAALARKKEQLKQRFDAEYDGDKDGEEMTHFDELKKDINDQLVRNDAAFQDLDPETRAQLEGYRQGTYVRIMFDNLPCEFVENFDPRYPILLGGLSTNEQNFGFIQVRIKRHRWHRKILKTNDPLIFSLGWRRFQSLPLYSLNDGARHRVLKYTPEHMHCLATFYGPITPPNTGFCCVQSLSNMKVSVIPHCYTQFSSPFPL
jgi:ribosome biogenesis protein BMS1